MLNSKKEPKSESEILLELFRDATLQLVLEVEGIPKNLKIISATDTRIKTLLNLLYSYSTKGFITIKIGPPNTTATIHSSENGEVAAKWLVNKAIPRMGIFSTELKFLEEEMTQRSYKEQLFSFFLLLFSSKKINIFLLEIQKQKDKIGRKYGSGMFVNYQNYNLVQETMKSVDNLEVEIHSEILKKFQKFQKKKKTKSPIRMELLDIPRRMGHYGNLESEGFISKIGYFGNESPILKTER